MLLTKISTILLPLVYSKSNTVAVHICPSIYPTSSLHPLKIPLTICLISMSKHCPKTTQRLTAPPPVLGRKSSIQKRIVCPFEWVLRNRLKRFFQTSSPP